MKRTSVLYLLFGCICAPGFGQIVVDPNYSVERLVTEVLVDRNCAETSNYRFSTGINFGINGIGYFEFNGDNFPYKEGIVISTGRAIDAVGPNDNTTSTNSSGHPQWSGDSDLSTITGVSGLFNASFIEFDFIPRANNMSFNFLFASEEYARDWQCSFSDVFAFILTDSNGVSSNLALVPGSQDLVSATSIRPGVPNSLGLPFSCEASNEAYFAGINGDDSAISMTGNTTSLVAQSLVNPGETYTIKLVIADNEDPWQDSAVFLEAGSFSVDVFLGENRTVQNGNPLCEGDIFEIDATVSGEAHYRWFKDGVQLHLFDDLPTVSVNEDGIYEVEVEFSANCISQGRVEIEYIDPFPLDISSTLQEEYILCLDGEGNPFEPLPKMDTKLSSAEYSFDWYRNSVSTGNLIANEDQPSLVPTEPGIYHVVVENLLYNCYLSLSTTVISSGPPTLFEVNILSDMFSNSHSVSINVEGPNEYMFSLDGLTFKEDNVFSNLAPGDDYIAYVQDEYKCSVVSKGVYIVDYPRFFTPNGDGVNDTWKIVNLFEIDNPEITIFDRFGIVQYQFNDEMGWDGTVRGNEAPSSSYWFSLTYDTKDGVRKEFKGYFALKR
ncbi:T9SS type B sorting domain-containing protein [Flagellimonas sp. HMM57]|uniref:T9SS type B sorting domain-containing protein n=1 Tax=unclassified Flagellimonas TaxID=2644544 RepID=UPI0013D88B9B|nr:MULTISPECIES: choice-of-anchor L domain-containing protein [unclassified Flagellimonas]UII76439.1 T9SS type B sorting domain-containing protein [Flagellimonas sp. HMM57]